MPPSPNDVPAGPCRQFAETRWSLVLLAGREDTQRAEGALAELCRAYYYPLYAFVRRSGHAEADAQDLTQEFFARLLEKRWLASADRERGRFRTFLLAALNHFLANEWKRSQAQKRGGGAAMVELDAATLEQRYRIEPADTATPEILYERRWADALLQRALDQLAREFSHDALRFEDVEIYLQGERGAAPFVEMAATLGVSESALKSVVHKLRRRHRELLRAEIAQTVAAPDEVDDEIRHLLRLFDA